MTIKADAVKPRIHYTPTGRSILYLTDRELKELRKKYPWMLIL